MSRKEPPALERTLYPLVRYLHDCLEAQTAWAREVNVLEQKDVFLLPLTAAQQSHLGTTGSLALSGPEANQLGNRHATGGSEVALRAYPESVFL